MNAVTPIRKSALSYLDWRVVEMARADGPRSLNPEGFLARVSRDLFGLPVATRLANDRLEALRRFSVRAWYWDLIRTADIRALLEGGYSRTHALEILAHVAPVRGFSPSIQEDSPSPSSGLEGWPPPPAAFQPRSRSARAFRPLLARAEPSLNSPRRDQQSR
jgi:hypothetical protein